MNSRFTLPPKDEFREEMSLLPLAVLTLKYSTDESNSYRSAEEKEPPALAHIVFKISVERNQRNSRTIPNTGIHTISNGKRAA